MSGLDNVSHTVRTMLTTVDTLTANDSVLISPFGASTIVVPTAISGRTYRVISVSPGGTDLISAANINGSGTYTINKSVEIVFDGVTWWTMSAS